MTHDRLIQSLSLAGIVGGAAACGAVLPRLGQTIENHVLRYTDVAVEGAPPVVALGQAIGALRGLIVDILWIKVNFMKQKGLYYEIMADSELITKLQPRFAAVWAFHGHNMAYNISVHHNTETERWEWVTKGIELVREQGLRYNPNDLQLHRELAFWFMHKIEGVSDDAHLYYKREFAREWHYLLGRPPVPYQERIEWIKKVADAPGTVDEAERRTPGVKALIERLRTELATYRSRFDFALDESFLRAYAEWEALRGESTWAQLFQLEQKTRRDNPFFVAFDDIASSPELAEAWDTLVAHVRKRVLIDEQNMSPRLMYEYTRDYGPIDWRSAYAHCLYFALRGSQFGEQRLALDEDDVYRIVNNDRLILQGMQGLSRWGRISFDPFSSDWVSRFPDPRWIAVIDRYWEQYSIKHAGTRGTGPDLFAGFHKNFLSSAVRELYRSGELQLAQRYLDRLNDLYGMGNPQVPDPKYAQPLETFVWEQVKEEYEFQPHLAPSDVAASLRYAFRVGIGRGREDVLENALRFAKRVTDYFKYNEYNKFVTKIGTARLGDLINELENSVPMVFAQVMLDGTIPLDERIRIWAQAPNDIKVRVYDQIRPRLEQQLQQHPLGQLMPFDTAFQEPEGLELYRIQRAEEAERRKAQEEERQGGRAEVERK